VGLAVAIAFLRGITRREVDAVGNFWVDLVRGLLWVLLPICLVGSLLLVSEGVVQNFRPYDRVGPIDAREQTIAQGPVASQEIVKMVGTNGGGFFNANSAHPFENPTPLSNLIELVAIFAIPSALTFVLGLMTRSRAHGWAVWAAMVFLFFAGVTTTYWSEARGNPILAQAGAIQGAIAGSPGGNMEGKEVRFGIAASSLFATVTTDASCGAVNGAHESFTPLGGMVPLANIMLGEVIFGGVGAGLYGMLVFIVLTVFIAGLMVGRTPEYLGKSIQAYEVQMAMLAILVFPLTVLVLTGISLVSSGFGLTSLLNHGPHGLTEVLYAFTSAAGNNGSAFAGLDANTPWYNTTIGLATLVGRFFVIIPTLAIAGSFGKKKRVPPSAGTFPVTSPLFAGLLVGVIVIVGALTFFPALSLGPIVEHLLMVKGQVF
jgi:potassium-transporting ATPase potassium-binding subunit